MRHLGLTPSKHYLYSTTKVSTGQFFSASILESLGFVIFVEFVIIVKSVRSVKSVKSVRCITLARHVWSLRTVTTMSLSCKDALHEKSEPCEEFERFHVGTVISFLEVNGDALPR